MRPSNIVGSQFFYINDLQQHLSKSKGRWSVDQINHISRILESNECEELREKLLKEPSSPVVVDKITSDFFLDELEEKFPEMISKLAITQDVIGFYSNRKEKDEDLLEKLKRTKISAIPVQYKGKGCTIL